jgi:hypothetical protein
MIAMLAATTIEPVGHTSPLQWLWVIVPVLALVATTTYLVVAGDPGGRRGFAAPWARAAWSLRRRSPLPPWSTAGIALGLWALTVAVVGFFWDVAWHIDLGRDRELFTVPHTLILTGLLGIGLAGLASIGLATVEEAPVTLRFGRLRLPMSALALGVLSGGAAVGFPIDDLWHRTYGIDVTMWSPTHLLMIGGASLTAIALWLMYAESGGPTLSSKAQKGLRRTLAAATLLGLSTFQLEFDLGVPQWQALYQPVLIALATSIALVAARAALGRGWALAVGLEFLVIRGALALLVGPGLGHDLPHFPLYLGMALVVEAAWLLESRLRPLQLAVVAGALMGTVGLATEWGFSHVFGRVPWQPAMLSMIWVATAIAVAGAVLGMAMGRVLSLRRAHVGPAALAAAGLATLGLLIVPLPRHGVDAVATVRTTPVGAATPVVDRDGVAGFEQNVNVEVAMTPTDAATGADWFTVQSWQGGAQQSTELTQVAPGVYRGNAAVPTGGTWKSIIFLMKRDVIASTPVSMPIDREYGLAAVPVVAERQATMVPASNLLLRESHGGAAWPMIVAYTGFAIMVSLWITTLVVCLAMLAVRNGAPPQGRTVSDVSLRGAVATKVKVGVAAAR